MRTLSDGSALGSTHRLQVCELGSTASSERAPPPPLMVTTRPLRAKGGYGVGTNVYLLQTRCFLFHMQFFTFAR